MKLQSVGAAPLIESADLPSLTDKDFDQLKMADTLQFLENTLHYPLIDADRTFYDPIRFFSLALAPSPN